MRAAAEGDSSIVLTPKTGGDTKTLESNLVIHVGDGATKWLKSHGVVVEFGMRAAAEGDSSIVLTPKKGGDTKTLEADLIIWATGAKPNTAWLKNTEFAAVIDSSGHIALQQHNPEIGNLIIWATGAKPNITWLKVTKFAAVIAESSHIAVGPDFRIKGYQACFALGDVTDIKETKLAYLAQIHGKMAGKNICQMAKTGKDDMKLTNWKPGGPIACVASIKSKSLFVPEYRQQLGVKEVKKVSAKSPSACVAGMEVGLAWPEGRCLAAASAPVHALLA
eukprot:gene22620-29763_t